jgi:hypothetical protein
VAGKDRLCEGGAHAVNSILCFRNLYTLTTIPVTSVFKRGEGKGAMRTALAACLLLVTTVASAEETTAERLDALEKRVQALEAIIGHQRMPASSGIPGVAPATGDATFSPQAGDTGETLLKLMKWSASFKSGQYSSYYYTISYTLRNNYDKPIKLTDGSIAFFDLVGEHIIGIKMDRDVRIASLSG